MKTESVMELLKTAYAAELETMQNYLANAVWLDGLQAQEIAKALGDDVVVELGHARRLAHRIKQLGGCPPGSISLPRRQEALQPSSDSSDLLHVVAGVLKAEREAIAIYERLIALCGSADPVTADLAVQILAEEEEHRCLFEGFLKGLNREIAAY